MSPPSAGEAEAGQGLADELRVAEVEIGEGARLLLALVGIDGGGGALHGIGDAVELGRLAAVPEAVERMGRAGRVVGHERLGHDGVGAARAGEAGGLGETADLDGHLARAGDFVDGVGELRVADEGLVGGVEEDDGAVALGVFDPRGELGPRGDGPGGIVGKTEVDQVRRLRGRRGHVAVGGRGIEIKDALVAAVAVVAGAAGHDVGVEIDRIDGIGNGDAGVGGEDFLNVAAVALGAVGDEDLVRFDLAAARLVVVPGDGLAQEGVALVGTVALEGLALGHLVGGGVERGDAHRRQRLGDVTDAEADEGPAGIGLLERGDAAGDVSEKIRRLELGVVFVDADHRAWERWMRVARTDGSQPGRPEQRT